MNKMKLNIQLFAGSVSIGTITETTDINTNQSTFTIPATMTTSGSTYNNDDAYMTLQWRYSGGSSWTTISKKTFGIGQNSSKTKSWTLSLTHNNDGTLTNVQFRVQWYITSSTSGTSSTKTVTPTTIPRASDIDSITDGTTTYSPTIIWTPKNENFKFKVKYTCGTNEKTSSLISPNTTSPYTYNSLSVDHTMFIDINSATTTATATLYTYQSDGTTLIGTKTATFNVTLNAGAKPSITISNLQEADDVIMRDLNWGIYVQNHSKLSFDVAIDGLLLYASNVSTTITTNNQTFNRSGYAAIGTTFTTNTLTTSGTNTISVTSTDSRGRQATASTTFNVVPYSNPTISTAQVQRCDADGNIDSTGDYCWVNFNASISSCGGNNKNYSSFSVGYREHEVGNYTTMQVASHVESVNKSGMLYTDGIYAPDRGSGTKLQLTSDKQWDIMFIANDTFLPVYNYQILDTGFDLLNFNPSGKAMAIGKVSEAGADEELLEVALPTKFTKYTKGEFVVEKIRSKNLLNENNARIGIAWNNASNTARAVCYVEIEPSTQYTLSYNDISGIDNIYYFEKTNLNDTTAITGVTNFTSGKTITTKANSNWLGIQFNKTNISINDIKAIKLQVEKGSTTTDYYPYQNLDSNEIYSEGEAKIGTWIDGQPLYRKVIAITTPTVTSDGTYPSNAYISTGLSNISTIYLKHAYIVANNSKYSFPYTTKSNGHLNIFINSSNALEVITNTTTFSNKSGYAILEYTKTTD